MDLRNPRSGSCVITAAGPVPYDSDGRSSKLAKEAAGGSVPGRCHFSSATRPPWLLPSHRVGGREAAGVAGDGAAYCHRSGDGRRDDHQLRSARLLLPHRAHPESRTATTARVTMFIKGAMAEPPTKSNQSPAAFLRRRVLAESIFFSSSDPPIGLCCSR